MNETESLEQARQASIPQPGRLMFLMACLCLMAILTWGVYASGFYAFGCDDYVKIWYSMDWGLNPSLRFDDVWVPLEFYVTGSVSRVIGDAYLASQGDCTTLGNLV